MKTPSSWEPAFPTRGDVLAFAEGETETFLSLYEEQRSVVLRTTDSGSTWIPAGPDIPAGLPVVALAVHGGRLFAGTVGSGVLSTLPGNEEWRPAGTGLPDEATVLTLIEHEKALFAGTQTAGVFHSTDGGRNWQPLNSGLPFDGSRLAIASLAATRHGLLAAHLMGLHLFAPRPGRWQALNPCLPGAHRLLGLEPGGTDRLVGWSANGIFSSDDGGASWAGLTPGFWKDRYVRRTVVFGSTLFSSTQGDGAGIYHSVDGGASWEEFGDGLPGPSWSVHIGRSGDHLLAGIGGFGVWRRPLPPAIQAAPALPFTLDQNDPNPFSTETMIAFTLRKNAQVRVEIRDVVGNHLETLLDEKRPAGSHRIRFDGSRLPDGLYACAMEVDGIARTRRMLILRT